MFFILILLTSCYFFLLYFYYKIRERLVLFHYEFLKDPFSIFAVIPWSWISCYTKLPNFLKLTCITCSQGNPWNIFLSLAGNAFSCCHSLYFWNCFVNILYIFVSFALWRLCVSDEMTAVTRRRVGRPKLPGSLKSIQSRESVFNLWRDRKEALQFWECTDSEFTV